MTKKEQLTKLSYDVINSTRNTIILNLRFFDSALSRLTPFESVDINLGTDGKNFIYKSEYLLKRYVTDSSLIVRDYLHIVLHCIFRHNFVDSFINRELWNLSCDIAVENMINNLDIRQAETRIREVQIKECAVLEKNAGKLTAEKLYAYFSIIKDKSYISRLSKIFYADDHSPWYMTDNEKKAIGIGHNNTDESENPDDNNSSSEYGSKKDWKNISERMQVDMETMSKSQGCKAGGLLQGLQELNREKYDYTAFLKKFAVIGEAMKVNDDEFDYIFYTYGLKLYKNMPLIEPLEYKEVKRIREFVIAIDTSGSVSGKLVQTFLNKTYNILQETESFFSHINLHIIQCDSEIQEHTKITTRDEFDEYIKSMQIKGLGGTDFRPVFETVNRLVAKKEFSNLKGLIYFTDGYGTFPERKPNYETAFVFIRDEYYEPEVPAWAIKLVLEKDEIYEEKVKYRNWQRRIK